jgi:hypothetical protein
MTDLFLFLIPAYDRDYHFSVPRGMDLDVREIEYRLIRYLKC